MNKKDPMVALLETACFELGVEIVTLPHKDYCLLKFNGKQILAKSWDLNLNGNLFDISSSKLGTSHVLEATGISHVPCFEAPSIKEEALESLLSYLSEQGCVVVRGDRGFSANNTFICRDEEQVVHALDTLQEREVKVLYSPFQEAEREYGVLLAGDQVSFVVEKIKNPDNELFNISKGAKAVVAKDPAKTKELATLTKQVASVFSLGFARIDIMDVGGVLKVLEISIPNVGKFSQINEENYLHSKEMMKQAILYRFQLS